MASQYPHTDTDLAIRLQSGDLQALAALIRRYQNPLIRYASYLGCSEPEDAVQESFLKMYQNIQSYQPERKLSSWLYRIVHNQVVSRLRARHFTLPFAEYLDGILPTSEPDLDLDFTKKRVKSCLGKLAPHYRAPLVLYYLEDKSYQEIMDILRLPMGTVAARISRAKNN